MARPRLPRAPGESTDAKRQRRVPMSDGEWAAVRAIAGGVPTARWVRDLLGDLAAGRARVVREE